MHEALAARVPADKTTDPDPPKAVAVPPHVLLRFGVAAMTRPAGKLSVKAMPVRPRPVFGFAIVKVSDVIPFTGIVAAPNTF